MMKRHIKVLIASALTMVLSGAALCAQLTPVTPVTRPPPPNSTGGAAGSPPPAGAAPAAPTPAQQRAAAALAATTALETKPAPEAVALPRTADKLVEGYGMQAQQSLILTYFAVGTLGDGLAGGSIPPADARRLADTYLTLATAARDDLRRIRAAYLLEPVELDSLDKLAAAYGDVIGMVEAARKLADAPGDPAARAACDSARRRGFATLAALFGWK